MLEDHAHVHAQGVSVHLEDVLAAELDLTLGADALDEVAHAVERAQERRLAAARRADERGTALLGDLEVDLLERLEVGVPQVEVSDVERDLRLVDAPVLGLGEFLLHSLLHQPNLPVR